MVTVKIPSKFIHDWSSAAESYITDIEQGIQYDQPVKQTIDKIENGQIVKRGKGYTVVVELTEDEAKFLKEEALYRYEFNSTNEYGVEDKDYVAGRAARKIYDALVEAGI
jgi:hypothetical protein